MNPPYDLLRRSLDEPKPRLVQRLLRRKRPCPEASGIFQTYEADYMGAAEFENEVLGEALAQACRACESEGWSVQDIHAGPDVTVYYVGPKERFETAARFLQTQLIEDRSDRYSADRPLKEATYLRNAYLCRDACFERLGGWWRIDDGYQFFLFKTLGDAEKCLSTLQATD
jgi:hypothetical protein